MVEVAAVTFFGSAKLVRFLNFGDEFVVLIRSFLSVKTFVKGLRIG